MRQYRRKLLMLNGFCFTLHRICWREKVVESYSPNGPFFVFTSLLKLMRVFDLILLEIYTHGIINLYLLKK